MSEPAFDITQPSPDAGHEAIRLAVVQAIEELGYNTESIDISLDLVDMLFQFLDENIAQRSALNIRIDATNVRCDTAIDGMDALQAEVAALKAKVATLEGHHVTLPGPDAAG